MASVTESVDVAVPVRTAYNQWTQFEEFPQFMEGVDEIRQIDDTHVHWKARVGGKVKEWDAEITEQRPDERVAWRNVNGQDNAGVVTFHKLDDGVCRVTVQIDAEPEGVTEKVGDALGVLERRVRGDLERFRDFIQSRGAESGAYRGEHTQDPTS